MGGKLMNIPENLEQRALEWWREYASYYRVKYRESPKEEVGIASIKGYPQSITIFRDVHSPSFYIYKAGKSYPLKSTTADGAIAEALERHPKGNLVFPDVEMWWKGES